MNDLQQYGGVDSDWVTREDKEIEKRQQKLP